MNRQNQDHKIQMVEKCNQAHGFCLHIEIFFNTIIVDPTLIIPEDDSLCWTATVSRQGCFSERWRGSACDLLFYKSSLSRKCHHNFWEMKAGASVTNAAEYCDWGGNSVKNYHANHRKTELGRMMNSVYK